MPRKEINYQNTVIYKIQHVDKDELIYVGHTTDFVKRKYKHKHGVMNNTSKSYHLKIYQMIRDNGGCDMFNMIEIKKFPCNDQREAASEEDKYLRSLKVSMNSRQSILDVQNKHQRENGKSICACGKSVTHKHKVRHEQSQRHIDGLLTFGLKEINAK